MKILDILKPEMIAPHLRGRTKEAVVAELAGLLAAGHPELNAEQLADVLRERERLGSTAIGDGIAIPHGKLPGLGEMLAAFGRSPEGVDFESRDGRPTHLFFLLVAPEDSAGVHLKALARLSRLLKDRSFRERLLGAGDGAELFRLIAAEDEKY